MKFFKFFAFMAIVSLAFVSCQKDNLDEQSLIKSEAQRPELPSNITVVPVEELPQGVNLTARTTNNIVVNDVKGTYLGKLYDVTMKGNKKDDVQNVYIDIIDLPNGNFDFKLRGFKVGKMPGKLSAHVHNLSLNTDGTFHATNTGKNVHLDYLWGFDYDVTLIEGSFTPVYGGYNLKFTLESEGSIWSFTIFKAHVKYDGDQQ